MHIQDITQCVVNVIGGFKTSYYSWCVWSRGFDIALSMVLVDV